MGGCTSHSPKKPVARQVSQREKPFRLNQRNAGIGAPSPAPHSPGSLHHPLRALPPPPPEADFRAAEPICEHFRAGHPPLSGGCTSHSPKKPVARQVFKGGKPFRLNQQNAGICAPSPAPQSPTKQARIFFDVVSQEYPDGSQKVPVGSGTVSEGLRSRIYFRERVCRLHNHFLCTCPCESLES